MLPKILISLAIFATLLLPQTTWAGTPAVTFEIPDTIQANESFILEIKITHDGQSAKDYVNLIKLSVDNEPLKTWNYTKTTREKEESWSEKINLVLDKDVTATVAVTTTKKEKTTETTPIKIGDNTATGEQVAPAAETEQTAAEEGSKNLDFTFWIFVVVIVLVIAIIIGYARRKGKGLM
jgi:cobalamin biosynthesis Mg chelatase CobN